MDERDADIFVDPAARCRRLARNIADDAAKRKLIGGGIRDDGGLAEGPKENRGAVERDERGSRSGTLATAFGGPSLRTQRSVYRREYRALQSIGLRV
jgi:hypothetical protein